MSKTIKTVARDYYAALHYAYHTKDFGPLGNFLSDDCVVTAINQSFVGKKASLQFMTNVISLMKTFEIRRQYFDHDSCCTVMDVITPIPDLHVKNIEWIVIRDGQVVEVNAVFDAQALNRFMHLIENGDLFKAKTLAHK